jgi:hypothetical protein
MNLDLAGEAARGDGWVLWLVRHTTGDVALIVLGSGLLLAMGAVLLANNYYTREQLIANNEVASFKFMFVAELFAGILAFLLIGAGSRYANAVAYINEETAAWRSLSQVVRTFPPEVAEPFQVTLSRYADSVVRTEWLAMETGGESPVSQRLFTDLVDYYFTIEPRDARQQSSLMLGNQLIGLANQARINRMNNNLNDVVADLTWFTLGSVVLITIVFNAFFGSLNLAGQLLLTAILTIGLLSNVLLTLFLGNPFVGATAVSPDPFIELITQ